MLHVETLDQSADSQSLGALARDESGERENITFYITINMTTLSEVVAMYLYFLTPSGAQGLATCISLSTLTEISHTFLALSLTLFWHSLSTLKLSQAHTLLRRWSPKYFVLFQYLLMGRRWPDA